TGDCSFAPERCCSPARPAWTWRPVSYHEMRGTVQSCGSGSLPASTKLRRRGAFGCSDGARKGAVVGNAGGIANLAGSVAAVEQQELRIVDAGRVHQFLEGVAFLMEAPTQGPGRHIELGCDIVNLQAAPCP